MDDQAKCPFTTSKLAEEYDVDTLESIKNSIGSKTEVPKLQCYIEKDQPTWITPATVDRDWMHGTSNRFAMRCLPLNTANSHGWVLRNPAAFTAVWNGGGGRDSVAVKYDKWGGYRLGNSHFGAGTLTFPMPGLYRTSPGYNLWVSGPPNSPKDGIYPLTGLVETDWSPFTFTMNWKFTMPGVEIRFEEGEPVCFFFLVRSKEMEMIEPEFIPVTKDKKLAHDLKRFHKSRNKFNAGLDSGDEETRKQGWQRWYFRGTDMAGNPPAPEIGHSTKIRFQPFKAMKNWGKIRTDQPKDK